MFSIGFYGATDTVTGSKFLVSAGCDKVLVECGMFQGLKEWRLRNWEPLPFDPRRLDAALVTHAHIDHTGYLPRLVSSGFSGPIYATSPTVDLCGILLPDSARLQEEQAENANKRGWSKHSPALPLYTAEDADVCLRSFVRFSNDRRRRLTPQVSLRFLDAGHILGSAIAELWLSDCGQETKIVFSGDLGRYNSKLLKDPTPVTEADYVLIESTYGDRVHPECSAGEELAECVHAIVRSGGILLVPAFSVGRTQQLLHELHKLEQCEVIPALPVYVDSPMAIDATNIFLSYPDDHRLEFRLLERNGDHPLRCKHLRFVRSARESMDLDSMNGPAIIISASGMATGGRVLNHLEAYLPDPNSIVLFAGFQAAGTRGRCLVDGAPEVKMYGHMVPVKAQIKQIEGLSAHGDYEDLLRWLGNFQKPPKKVFVVHGEPTVARAMAEKIEDRLGFSAYVPQYEEVVTLDG